MVKRKFHIGWLYEVSDVAPRKERYNVLKLKNELREYVSRKDGMVTIKVVK